MVTGDLTRRESLKLLVAFATTAVTAAASGCCRHGYPQSQIEHWSEYPQRLAHALKDTLPLDKLFGANAVHCFRL